MSPGLWDVNTGQDPVQEQHTGQHWRRVTALGATQQSCARSAGKDSAAFQHKVALEGLRHCHCQSASPLPPDLFSENLWSPFRFIHAIFQLHQVQKSQHCGVWASAGSCRLVLSVQLGSGMICVEEKGDRQMRRHKSLQGTGSKRKTRMVSWRFLLELSSGWQPRPDRVSEPTPRTALGSEWRKS